MGSFGADYHNSWFYNTSSTTSSNLVFYPTITRTVPLDEFNEEERERREPRTALEWLDRRVDEIVKRGDLSLAA